MKCCCLLCWRATYNSREACSRQISSSTQFRVCSPTACSPLQPCHEVPEKRCAGAVVARSVAIMPGLRSPGRPCNCLQLTACSSPAWLADHTHQDAHICCKPNSRAAGATSGAGRNRRRRLAARAGAGALHSCSLPPPPPPALCQPVPPCSLLAACRSHSCPARPADVHACLHELGAALRWSYPRSPTVAAITPRPPSAAPACWAAPQPPPAPALPAPHLAPSGRSCAPAAPFLRQ